MAITLRTKIVGTIDREHTLLVEYMNELETAMKSGQGASKLPSLITRLLNYTKTHFENEMRLLRKHGYQAANGHEQLHGKLVREVENLKTAIDENRATAMMALDVFDLILKHIDQEDVKFTSFLKEKGEQ